MSLPEGWAWEPYESLTGVDDPSCWAVEFLTRGEDFETYRRLGGGVLAEGDGRWRTAWQKGVLCYGMKGHDTSAYLKGVVEWAARKAVFHPGADGCQPVPDARLSDGQVATTWQRDGVRGYLVFTTPEDFKTFDAIRRAVYGTTLELAVNLRQPTRDILKEVERLLAENKRRLTNLRMVSRVPNATKLQWARGLACWDLVHGYDWAQAEVAKHLGPLWTGEDIAPAGPGDPADPVDKAKVGRSLAAVEPYIAGRWRDLVGDPLGALTK